MFKKYWWIDKKYVLRLTFSLYISWDNLCRKVHTIKLDLSDVENPLISNILFQYTYEFEILNVSVIELDVIRNNTKNFNSREQGIRGEKR